jgi:prepilin-type N-terminal cleavage/methylation domain-containing protein
VRAGSDAAARRGARAFTLLEVLAAVAVFGLVYVVVARAAIEGLGVEGDAGRRLRASLLADRVLGELETGIASGVAPPPGRSQLEEDDFQVQVEVAPLDPAALGLAPALVAPEREGRSRSRREPGEGSPLESGAARRGGEAPSLFEPTPGADAAPLVQIQVRVDWLEGAVPQHVSRTTFALDSAAAAPLLEGLPDASQEADGETPLDEEALPGGSETPDSRFRAPDQDQDEDTL